MKSVDIKPREILSDVASLFNLVGESFTRLKLKFKVHRMTRAYNWNLLKFKVHTRKRPTRWQRGVHKAHTPVHHFMVMMMMTMMMTMIIMVIMMTRRRTHGSYNCHKLGCEGMTNITCFEAFTFWCFLAAQITPKVWPNCGSKVLSYHLYDKITHMALEMEADH